jgi:long-chain acyl-CoA synthetase
MNIVEPIFAQSRNKSSELALCAPGTDFNLVSYARLQRSVDNICRRIIASGIAPHSRVGVAIEDPIFHIMVVIALTRLGIVTVAARGGQVQWPFRIDAVIADRQYDLSSSVPVMKADPTWTEGDDQPLAEKHIYRAAPDELCRIFVTSGNGRGQTAIAMTHGMIATRIDRQKLLLGPRAPFCDRTHLDLKLTTAIGFQVALGTLWRGGALVMTWDMRKTLAALADYKVQNIVATPRSLLKFASAVESDPGYRIALTAAFSIRGMTQEKSDWVRARLCANLTVGYVAADATMVASMPAQFASVNPDAVGYVLPGVLVEIVDEQDRNGWFYPGERGHLTEDNMLVLANADQSGAASSVERVEQILSNHVNVMQCCVVTVANELNAEELCALVVSRSYFDAEALRSYSRAHLPAALVPTHFVAVSDLPHNPAGDIDRTKLPELLKSKMN